ncbi:hypothetical protein DFH06DRAFT_1118794 [Mycena polygramma]|nr:hypothetical protein DFH06DRAFT_1118794 [Mycena polygramma]
MWTASHRKQVECGQTTHNHAHDAPARNAPRTQPPWHRARKCRRRLRGGGRRGEGRRGDSGVAENRWLSCGPQSWATNGERWGAGSGSGIGVHRRAPTQKFKAAACAMHAAANISQDRVFTGSAYHWQFPWYQASYWRGGHRRFTSRQPSQRDTVLVPSPIYHLLIAAEGSRLAVARYRKFNPQVRGVYERESNFKEECSCGLVTRKKEVAMAQLEERRGERECVK